MVLACARARLFNWKWDDGERKTKTGYKNDVNWVLFVRWRLAVATVFLVLFSLLPKWSPTKVRIWLFRRRANKQKRKKKTHEETSKSNRKNISISQAFAYSDKGTYESRSRLLVMVSLNYWIIIYFFLFFIIIINSL